MNNKAQMEIHPVAIAGGILGAILGVYMANQMMAGPFMKIIVFLVVGVVCFFVTNLIMNKD